MPTLGTCRIRLYATSTILLAAAGLVLACAPQPAAPVPRFWGGDPTPVVSVKELMRDVIDPLSDHIFLAVGSEITAAGVIDHAPATDADWAKVRSGAVGLAEVAHLLKVPRPFAPPGDSNLSEGPDAPEISPAAILEKLEQDPVLWQAKVEALRNAALATMEIVERRDAQALFDIGEELDAACENCHLEFWYPGQRALMPKLDQKLRDTFGAAPGQAATPGRP